MGKTALAQIFRSDGAHFQKSYTLVRSGAGRPSLGLQRRAQDSLKNPKRPDGRPGGCWNGQEEVILL